MNNMVFSSNKFLHVLPIFFGMIFTCIFQFGEGAEILTFTRPQASIYFFYFDKNIEISLGADVRNYSIALALTEFECPVNPEIDNPGLNISSGSNGQQVTWSCFDINEEHGWRPITNKFQAFKAWQEIGSKSIVITRSGVWTSENKAEATLIASIYRADGSDCSADEFNCNQNCNLGTRNTINQLSDKTLHIYNTNRCIPEKLKCDSRPSCGLICNPDELEATCAYDYNLGDGLAIGITISIVAGALTAISMIGYLCYFICILRLRRRQQKANRAGLVFKHEDIVTNFTNPNGTLNVMAVPKLIRVLYTDSELVQNRERFCLALGITPSQMIDINRTISIHVSNTDGFFTLALQTWITNFPNSATMNKLIDTLIDENFHSAAEKMIKLADEERRPSHQTIKVKTEIQITNH